MQHPLHSRAVSVTLAQRADARLDAHGMLLDLRKRGIVPVAGDLGTPGIVHHMELDAVIEPRIPRLDELTARQPQVAFEPLPVTGGESCRDPLERLAALHGTPLDADFARRLSAVAGGPRGCSHILTLAQVLGATAQWALRPDGVAPCDDRRRPGERVFRRDLVVDGVHEDDGALVLVAQLTDVAFAPAPDLAPPMDRFAAMHEVRVWAPVSLTTMTLGAMRAVERHRDTGTLAETNWVARSARLAALDGLSVFRGISAALFAHLGDDPADRPLLDAMLLLAPTFIQVCGTLSDDWLARCQATGSLIGMGGMPDACYMWRRGGTLDQQRSAQDPPPLL